MKHLEKLKTYSQIKNVINNGEKILLKTAVVYKMPTKEPKEKPQIGILSSKKFGNAVKRNYAKRRIVAAINKLEPIDKDFIFVFIPRQQILKIIFSKMLKEFESVLK